MEPLETHSSNQHNNVNLIENSSIQSIITSKAEASNSPLKSLSTDSDFLTNYKSKNDGAENVSFNMHNEPLFTNSDNGLLQPRNASDQITSQNINMTCQETESCTQPVEDTFMNGSDSLQNYDCRPNSNMSTSNKLSEIQVDSSCGESIINESSFSKLDLVNQNEPSISPSEAKCPVSLDAYQLQENGKLQNRDLLESCIPVVNHMQPKLDQFPSKQVLPVTIGSTENNVIDPTLKNSNFSDFNSKIPNAHIIKSNLTFEDSYYSHIESQQNISKEDLTGYEAAKDCIDTRDYDYFPINDALSAEDHTQGDEAINDVNEENMLQTSSTDIKDIANDKITIKNCQNPIISDFQNSNSHDQSTGESDAEIERDPLSVEQELCSKDASAILKNNDCDNPFKFDSNTAQDEHSESQNSSLSFDIEDQATVIQNNREEIIGHENTLAIQQSEISNPMQIIDEKECVIIDSNTNQTFIKEPLAVDSCDSSLQNITPFIENDQTNFDKTCEEGCKPISSECNTSTIDQGFVEKSSESCQNETPCNLDEKEMSQESKLNLSKESNNDYDFIKEQVDFDGGKQIDQLNAAPTIIPNPEVYVDITDGSCSKTRTNIDHSNESLMENLTAASEYSAIDLENNQTVILKDTSCVMQRVVGGTLQPLDINNIDQHGSIKDPAIFAGVTQEMKLLTSDEASENVHGIMPESVTETQDSGEELVLETDYVTHQLTDLTMPNLDIGSSHHSSDLPSSKRIKLDEEEESSNHKITEERPLILKVLPLKNGTGLWDIEDLKFALGERGSILLRLCAAPEASDEGVVDCPYADFTALFLEDAYEMQEIPMSTSDCDPEMSLFKNSTAISEHSFNSGLSNDIPQQIEEDSGFPHLDSADSLAEFISEWPENLLNRKSLPPPKGSAQSKLNTNGKKRGRPPLIKGSLAKKTKNKKNNESVSFQTPLSPPQSIEVVDEDKKVNSTLPSVESPELPPISIKHASLQPSNNSVKLKGKVPITEINFVKANNIYNRKLVKKIKVQCGFCPTQVRHKYALINHMRAKHGDETRCPICKVDIEDDGSCDMKFHILKVHKTDKLYRCNKCSDSFRTERLIANHKMFVHNEGIVYPQHPSSSESESDSVLKRLRSHNVDNNSSKANESIDINQDGANSDREGCQSMHEEESEQLENSSKEPTEFISKDSEVTKRLRSSRSLKSLEPVSDDKKGAAADYESASESGNESDVENSDSDAEREETKRYFCKTCGIGFSHMFKLRHHKRTHGHYKDDDDPDDLEEKDPLLCKKCGKKCRNSYQYKLHIIQHNLTHKKKMALKDTKHNDFKNNSKNKPKSSNLIYRAVSNSPSHKEKEDSDAQIGDNSKSDRPPYIVRKGRVLVCTKCDVNFKKEKQMTYHLKKIHETLYPFRACPECGRIFRSCGPYMRHIIQHRTQRCPVEGCKAKYRNHRLIRKHQRHSHSNLPFRCNRCVHIFAKESQLLQHQRNAHGFSSDGKDKIPKPIATSSYKKEKSKPRESQPIKEKEEESEEDIDILPKKVTRSQDKMLTTYQEFKGKRMSLALRRLRLSPVSYKEDDDDDFDNTRPERISKLPRTDLRSKLRKKCVSRSEGTNERTSIKEPIKRSSTLPKRNSSISTRFSSTIVNNSLNSQKNARILSPKSKPILSPIKTKRKLLAHRKIPNFKKKNIDTSWTAALKAQYRDNLAKMKQAQKEAKAKKKEAKARKFSVDSSLAPAITADVVRRVAESLLSRQHQEASIDSSNLKDSPPASNCPTPSQMMSPPRVSSSGNALSTEESLSSLEDSFQDDNKVNFSTSSLSPVSAVGNVPEDEGDGPPGVIRFDYF